MKRRALGLGGLVASGLLSLPALGQPPPEPPPDAPAEPAEPANPARPGDPGEPVDPGNPPTAAPDAEPPAADPDDTGGLPVADPDAPGDSPTVDPAVDPDEPHGAPAVDPAASGGVGSSAIPAPPATGQTAEPGSATSPPTRAEPAAPTAPAAPATVPPWQRGPRGFGDVLVAGNERLPTLWKPPPNAVYLGVVDSALAVPLESLGLLALVTYTGFSDWKWGTASFRFNSEGWFGMNTGSGGMDKIGHAYGAYMASELLYWRLRASQDDRPVVSFYPAMFGMLLYLYIEMFDGYSVDHGFAYEDVITDTLGVLLSTARNTIPAIRRGFDFRLEYFPSKGFDFHPVIDYEGQKFMGVFKLAAFPALERSPARFVELMVGYYTRGFDKELDVDFKKSHLFFGLGFSLEQLFFKPLDRVYGWPFGFMGLAANYFQLPGTYMSAESVRTAPTRKRR